MGLTSFRRSLSRQGGCPVACMPIGVHCDRTASIFREECQEETLQRLTSDLHKNSPRKEGRHIGRVFL